MNSEFRRSEAFKVETEAFVILRNHQPIAIIHDETAYTKFIEEDCADIMETDGLTKEEVLSRYAYDYEAIQIVAPKR